MEANPVTDRSQLWTSNVFLPGDIVEPDTVSQQLMKSGDVESNPGPNTCKDCGRLFSGLNKPVQCNECGEEFCKTARKGQNTTCCGLTRWQLEQILKKDKRLLCRICKGESSRTRNIHHTIKDVVPGFCARRGCKSSKTRRLKKGQFLLCIRCRKQFHYRKECSDMTRKQVDILDRDRWVCPNCEEDEVEKETIHNREAQVEQATQYKQSATKETTLRILQLNIDSILSKVEELKECIRKNKIDIFVIQETKLIRSDKTPRIPGYTVERKDRDQPKGKEKDRGGGLITGIKKSIAYKRMDMLSVRGAKDKITESLIVEIPTKDKQKLRITNMYVPPVSSGTRLREEGSGSSDTARSGDSSRRRVNNIETGTTRSTSGRGRNGISSASGRNTRVRRSHRGRVSDVRTRSTRRRGNQPVTGEELEEPQEQRQEGRDGFVLERWPAKNCDMICGDVNAHSLLWDNSVAGKGADKRGEVIETWAADKNMIAVNDGSHTLDSRSTGSQTAPDVTLVHASLLDKVTWGKVEGLGSDHVPIVVTYKDHILRINCKPSFK